MRDPIIYRLMYRLVDISVKHNLGHLGSCLTTLPILFEIYSKKGTDDKVILSNGHAGLALYVILEYFYGIDAEQLLIKHGIHPDRDIQNYIDVATGSLGLGITVATGIAVGDKNINVHCIISDGECAEGSVWESLRFISDFNVDNITIHCNINGWSAYQSIDGDKLEKRLKSFLENIVIHKTDVSELLSWKNELAAHYTSATDEILNELKNKIEDIINA